MSTSETREQWQSQLGFLLSSVGSVVGLGTLWRLPYVMGQNGGGAFIVLFLAIPFAFQKSGGKVKAIGLALAVAFSYFGLMEVGGALGQKSCFPPLLAAWMANLKAAGADILFAQRLAYFNLKKSYIRDPEGFPLESIWAERHSEEFKRVYASSWVRIYEIRK